MCVLPGSKTIFQVLFETPPFSQNYHLIYTPPSPTHGKVLRANNDKQMCFTRSLCHFELIYG